MELEAIHKTLEEIPEGFRELYTEKNGQWELTGVKGIKTQADIDRQAEALKKEKNDHKAAKEKLAVWGELNHDEVVAKLERYPELEEASKGKLDEAKLDEMATKRAEALLRSRLSPIERENRDLKKKVDELTLETTTLKTKESNRTIQDELRKALVAAKVLPEAYDDAFLLGERVLEVTDEGKVLTKENAGWTPGIGPEAWVSELQDKRVHWWPPAQGGNAKGSGPRNVTGSANPWSHEGWNSTAQGAFVRSHGREKAEQMAKAAGTTFGGTRPKPKPAVR